MSETPIKRKIPQKWKDATVEDLMELREELRKEHIETLWRLSVCEILIEKKKEEESLKHE